MPQTMTANQHDGLDQRPHRIDQQDPVRRKMNVGFHARAVRKYIAELERFIQSPQSLTLVFLRGPQGQRIHCVLQLREIEQVIVTL